ncbi:uncharacterized protein LOC119652354 isoform X2 [Hermetia illucens]|uniref:uncharacterized protein LOC119652354 isoform X2 n=1 Tax=Hermetia illucens TaxID=343691 RepID=UPI0018CC0744|nr:uncharacterized protein LOC119652354 isoform X2 [Hermetia illucens]
MLQDKRVQHFKRCHLKTDLENKTKRIKSIGEYMAKQFQKVFGNAWCHKYNPYEKFAVLCFLVSSDLSL